MYVDNHGDRYWRIQVSRGRGVSPASTIWRPPAGTNWSISRCQREAEKVEAQIALEVQNGTWKSSREKAREARAERDRINAAPTFEQFATETFLPQKVLSITARTCTNYKSVLEHHVFPTIGSTIMEQITVGEIQAVVNEMFKDLGYQTAAAASRLVHQILQAAYRLDVIPADPWTKVTLPKLSKDQQLEQAEKAEQKALSVDEARAAWTALESEPLFWRAFFTAALDTGCRIGELCGLQWDDLAGNFLQIRRQYIYDRADGGFKIVPVKTVQSRRSVDLGQVTLHTLALLRVEQAKSGYNGPWIFPGQVDGRPVTPSASRKALNRFTEANGIRHITPHCFRHSMATLGLNAGASVLAVSRRLGHSNVTTTTNIYTHAAVADVTAAGNAFRSVLDDC